MQRVPTRPGIIDRRRAEFVDRRLELRFEKAQWRHSLRRAQIAMPVVACCYLVFIYADFRILGPSPQAIAVVVGRVLFALLTAWTMVRLAGQRHDPPHFYRFVVIWVALGSILSNLAAVTRPITYSGNLFVELMSMVVVYFLLPLRPNQAAALALADTALFFGSFRIWQRALWPDALLAVVTLAMIHTIGLVVGRDLHVRQRLLYHALGAERAGRRAVAQALARAEAADRSKSMLIAAVAHELRTPLNGIVGFAGLLAQSRLSRAQREQLDILRAAAGQLRDLVGDSLEWARLDRQAPQPRREPFDPRELAASCLSMIGIRVATDQVAIDLAVDPAVPDWLVGDPAALRQILTNLLDNAAHHTREGRIRLAVGPGDAAGTWRWSVEDSGPGLAPDRVSAIFEPFVRDARPGDADNRLGLGLAIVRKRAEAMGGSVGAENRPQGGSRFWADLPLAIGTRPVETGALPAADRPGLSLLVVEDDRASRRLAELALGRLGHRVIVVESRQAALLAASRTRFDALLLDLWLRDDDGLAVLAALRGAGVSAPAIGVSAHAGPEERQRCLDGGMAATLTKPLDFHGLDDLLQALLAGHSLPDPPRSADQPYGQLVQDLGADQARTLLRIFMDDHPRHLADLAAAIGGGQVQVVRAIAHRLASSAGAVGATAARAAALAIESAPDAPPEMLAEILAPHLVALRRACAAADQLSR